MKRQWPLLLVFAATMLRAQPPVALGPAARYAVSLDSVAHAVLLAHPELASATFALPAAIEARTPAPFLQAGPVERLGAAGQGSSAEGEGHVRVRCETEAECLPFMVAVHGVPAEPAAKSTKGGQRFSGQSRTVDVGTTDAGARHCAQAPMLSC